MKKTLFKKVETFIKKIHGNPSEEVSQRENDLTSEAQAMDKTNLAKEPPLENTSFIKIQRENSKAYGKPLLLEDRTYNTDKRIESPKEEHYTIQSPLIQQKEIIHLILQTQEQERKRIAEGLHNGLGQLLYAIKLKFESLGLTNESWSHTKVPSEIESLLNEAIEQTRNISFELMPAILKDFGLEITIRELCKRIDQGSIKFHSSISIDRKIDGSLETAIFRIVQELLNNVIRHSKATEAHILIQEKNSYFLINVKDNGQGFDTRSLDKVKGIGICSIRNRIKLLDGEFEIISSLQKGTEVILKIPRS